MRVRFLHFGVQTLRDDMTEAQVLDNIDAMFHYANVSDPGLRKDVAWQKVMAGHAVEIGHWTVWVEEKD